MRRSQRVTLRDIRRIYEVVHECRELWADPPAWQRHAMTRAAALAGCRLGLCYEIADGDGFNADRLLSAEDVGWESASERRALAEGIAHQPLRYSPLWAQFSDALPPRGSGGGVTSFDDLLTDPSGLTLAQARLIERDRWHRCEWYDHFVRPTRLGDGIMSGVWMNGTGTWSCWCLVTDRPDGEPTPRGQRLTRLLHREVAALIGGTLSTWRDRTTDTLSDVRRGVLAGLLDGLSEREVADATFRSPAAVHEHVTAIYRHFGVSSRAQLAAFFIRHRPGPADPPRPPPAGSAALDRWLRRAWTA